MSLAKRTRSQSESCGSSVDDNIESERTKTEKVGTATRESARTIAPLVSTTSLTKGYMPITSRAIWAQ